MESREVGEVSRKESLIGMDIVGIEPIGVRQTGTEEIMGYLTGDEEWGDEGGGKLRVDGGKVDGEVVKTECKEERGETVGDDLDTFEGTGVAVIVLTVVVGCA